MMKHKDDTVAANVNGVGFLLKKNKIDAFPEPASIKGAGKVDVTADDGKVTSLETREHRHRNRLGCGDTPGCCSRIR